MGWRYGFRWFDGRCEEGKEGRKEGRCVYEGVLAEDATQRHGRRERSLRKDIMSRSLRGECGCGAADVEVS